MLRLCAWTSINNMFCKPSSTYMEVKWISFNYVYIKYIHTKLRLATWLLALNFIIFLKPSISEQQQLSQQTDPWKIHSNQFGKYYPEEATVKGLCLQRGQGAFGGDHRLRLIVKWWQKFCLILANIMHQHRQIPAAAAAAVEIRKYKIIHGDPLHNLDNSFN